MPVDQTSATAPTSTAHDPCELEAATEILAMLTSNRLEPASDCRADGDGPTPVRYGITGAMLF